MCPFSCRTHISVYLYVHPQSPRARSSPIYMGVFIPTWTPTPGLSWPIPVSHVISDSGHVTSPCRLGVPTGRREVQVPSLTLG